VKQITKYQANDGSEWDTEDGAIQRDQMIEEVDRIMEPLGKRPTGHGEFVQRDLRTVTIITAALFEIADRDGVLKWWIDGQRKAHGRTTRQLIHYTHPSWFLRMLDGNHDPLERAYGRLCCIDKRGREWDQPYFANESDKEAPP
jgi:hypothetical protein